MQNVPSTPGNRVSMMMKFWIICKIYSETCVKQTSVGLSLVLA